MLDLTALRAAFHAGDTLYLTKAHRAWPPLMRLCRGVENELRGDGVRLRAPVSAHVFLTPPRSQGFAAHRDEHASLVLQLEGTKDWDVYEEDPDDDGQPRAPYRTGRVDVDRLRAVRQTFTLTPGNVLYLPEWWVHAARTGDRHSLHVTLRVFPLRWVDLLTAVLPQVDGLDRPVPHERAGSDGAARLAEDLVARLTSARVRAAISPLVRSHLDGTRVPTTALPDDGLGGVLAADRLGVTTRLARSAGTACAVATHGDVATLSFPGGTLTGPAELGPVFTYIADAVRFRPADLPAVGGEYDRTALARELLLAGVVRVEDAEGEAR
jgi:hypothetical protein